MEAFAHGIWRAPVSEPSPPWRWEPRSPNSCAWPQAQTIGLTRSNEFAGRFRRRSPVTPVVRVLGVLVLQLPRSRHRARRVLARDRIPPDAQNFHEHSQSVPERMQPRPLAVRPQNRNLIHPQARSPRQKQNFRIESPALNFLQRKNALRGVPAKGFESALGVGETQA